MILGTANGDKPLGFCCHPGVQAAADQHGQAYLRSNGRSGPLYSPDGCGSQRPSTGQFHRHRVCRGMSSFLHLQPQTDTRILRLNSLGSMARSPRSGSTALISSMRLATTTATSFTHLLKSYQTVPSTTPPLMLMSGVSVSFFSSYYWDMLHSLPRTIFFNSLMVVVSRPIHGLLAILSVGVSPLLGTCCFVMNLVARGTIESMVAAIGRTSHRIVCSTKSYSRRHLVVSRSSHCHACR